MKTAPAARSFRDDGCILGRDKLMAGDRVAFPAIRGDQALDAGVGLGHDGNAPQGAAHESGAARFGFRVLACSGRERSFTSRFCTAR